MKEPSLHDRWNLHQLPVQKSTNLMKTCCLDKYTTFQPASTVSQEAHLLIEAACPGLSMFSMDVQIEYSPSDHICKVHRTIISVAYNDVNSDCHLHTKG